MKWSVFSPISPPTPRHSDITVSIALLQFASGNWVTELNLSGMEMTTTFFGKYWALSSDAVFSSLPLADSPPRDLQITAYK